MRGVFFSRFTGLMPELIRFHAFFRRTWHFRLPNAHAGVGVYLDPRRLPLGRLFLGSKMLQRWGDLLLRIEEVEPELL
eukprot:10030159-Heterocapsa_arctica.AAC.1